MKANELMIGDWVLVNGVPRQVSQITKHKIGYHRAELPFGECKMSYAKLVETKPIPLTAEILEKNGFVQDEYDYFWVVKNPKYGYHTLLLYSSEDADVPAAFLGHWAFDENYAIDYIHELQQVLRLCGLADLADNFKI